MMMVRGGILQDDEAIFLFQDKFADFKLYFIAIFCLIKSYMIQPLQK